MFLAIWVLHFVLSAAFGCCIERDVEPRMVHSIQLSWFGRDKSCSASVLHIQQQLCKLQSCFGLVRLFVWGFWGLWVCGFVLFVVFYYFQMTDIWNLKKIIKWHGKVNCISVLLITYTVFLCEVDSNRPQVITVPCKLLAAVKMSLAC